MNVCWRDATSFFWTHRRELVSSGSISSRSFRFSGIPNVLDTKDPQKVIIPITNLSKDLEKFTSIAIFSLIAYVKKSVSYAINH